MSDRTGSIQPTRDGDASARRPGHTSRRFIALLGLVALLIVSIGYWAGFRRGSRHADARVEQMQARLDSLTEENAKVVELAARMEELEAGYGRLRAVMGGDVRPSARDILLPPMRSERVEAPSRRSATGRPGLWPLVEAGFVTRSFGDSVPGEAPHPGLDIAVPVGSYVRATGSGIVLETGDDEEYGRYVRIEHDEQLRTLYAHNSWTFVSPGDSVEAGEVIALSGNSGRSTAPHLHLEVERGGSSVDPLPFVADRI